MSDVAVEGDFLPITLAQFVERAKVLLADEQEKPAPDNALIGFLCDSIRLARENNRLGGGAIPTRFASWTFRVIERAHDVVLILRGPNLQGASFDVLADSVRAEVLREFANENECFQVAVRKWMLECFGAKISADKVERNHRFLEESLELVQALGCTASEAHQLVDYVYGRPVGDPSQETGGVMVTLAALCDANHFDMTECAEAELARIWGKVVEIRAKQAAKPKHSPLPSSEPGTDDSGAAATRA